MTERDPSKKGHLDIQRRLVIASTAFYALQAVWRSTKYNSSMKFKIFSTNLVSVQLSGAEMWRVTVADSNRLNVFHRKCLRRILRIHWPDNGGTQDTYSGGITTTKQRSHSHGHWRGKGKERQELVGLL